MDLKGFFQVPNYLLEIRLTPIQKLVLICLMRTGNQRAAIYPSYKTIARRCDISVRTAIKVMHQLDAIGVIYIKKRKLHDSNNTNLYTLDMKTLERMYREQDTSDVDLLKSAVPYESASPGSEPDSPHLVNDMHPINNPNKEPDIKNHKTGHTPLRSPALSFEDYKAEYSSSHCTLNIEAASYFVKTYNRVLGKEHKSMRAEVWRKAIDQILEEYTMVSGEAEYSYEDDGEGARALIDCYFMKTDKFEQPCDFSLPHFNSPKVKAILSYEYWRY